MPCLLAIIALCFPRLVIVVLALATNYLSTAYHTLLWPVLGFFFAPFTTLAYAVGMNAQGSISGGYLVLVVVAVLLDLGVVGGSHRAAKRRE